MSGRALVSSRPAGVRLRRAPRTGPAVGDDEFAPLGAGGGPGPVRGAVGRDGAAAVFDGDGEHGVGLDECLAAVRAEGLGDPVGIVPPADGKSP
ncbi:hypothetical protein SGRIM128S_07054 [Streptomyces griseomycini]